LTFNGLHGTISQKTELFISTAVRTLNPIYSTKVPFHRLFFSIHHSQSYSISTLHSLWSKINK
jgi:hypothetical protein